jgi:hypothetical protein
MERPEYNERVNQFVERSSEIFKDKNEIKKTFQYLYSSQISLQELQSRFALFMSAYKIGRDDESLAHQERLRRMIYGISED